MSKRSKYTAEEKYKILIDYENGIDGFIESKKYELPNGSVFKLWINKYNCHREILGTPKGMKHSV
ncbi:transposase [Clostridium botulinum]|uniref:transposase n=1 Tax=Clostridium sp. ZBS17 TaxID=2949968 RepID=UPI0013F8624B|nr:transposase [Clostridium sp. ZBS17]NFN94475.1 transposase [Clostridium botulinum]NFS96520.1 transposase [Clostridium botulinum]